jgi:hypothetical protein
VLLLCSDGLWNHLPDPEVLARLARPALGGTSAAENIDEAGVPDHPALAAAAALLAAALDDGGHDNASIALIPMAPPAGAVGRPSVTVDGRGPDERTGPIPLDGEGVVDR